MMTMATDDLFRKIFEHQLLLSKEMQSRLKDHLTPALKAIFKENQEHLEFLLKQENPSQDDLNKMQEIWEKMTAEIDRLRQEADGEIDALNAEEKITEFYK